MSADRILAAIRAQPIDERRAERARALARRYANVTPWTPQPAPPKPAPDGPQQLEIL